MLLLRWSFFGDTPGSWSDQEDDPREEYDDDWQFIPVDLVFDTDQITIVLDDQEAPYEEDNEPVQDRIADLVFDTDQVIVVADTQEVDPDEDADLWSAYGQTDVPPQPSQNEQIVFIPDTQDEDFVLDPEDDLWNAYGQTDPYVVFPPTPTRVHYPGSEWQKWDQTWEPRRPMI